MAVSDSPLASAKPSYAGLCFAIIFGLLFATAGLIAFWFFTLHPLLRASESSGWVETPCEIISSELSSESDSDSTTYRVEIRFRYNWEGGPRESDRYDFSTGSTNVGVKRMRAAVRAHPPGLRTICFVDPADPAFAVLNRGVATGVWFGALTLAFPAFGLVFIFVTWRSTHKARAEFRSPLRASSSFIATTATNDLFEGETVLKPASGRLGAFIGITIFALIWNGIISVLVVQAVKEAGQGFIGWFLPIFLIPFVLIGLLTIAAAIQAFSRLFAPPVEVRLDLSRLRLGTRVPFTWRLGGQGVRKLTIRLVAREEATYRQGTTTTTDKADFFRATIFESTDRLSLRDGRAEIMLPAQTVAPAFTTKNNRLSWELVFEGEIPWRADVNDHFVLPVHGAVAPVVSPAIPEPRAHPGAGFTLWTIDRFAPGDTLVFTLVRQTGSSAGPITAQLGWFTEGKGTRDAAVVWSEQISGLPPGGERSFEVRLPDGPWSFSGKLVSVSWRLEVLDAKQNPIIAVPLVIAPSGTLVTLPTLSPEPSAFQKRKARYLARQ